MIGTVVGYTKKSIKVRFSNKKVEKVYRGLSPPYDAFYPLGTKVTIKYYTLRSGKKEPAVISPSEIFQRYPNKNAYEIQLKLSKLKKYKDAWWTVYL
tara:strand:- start:207 stop:497 length:291 start_codon:yes stop_codon:yes gene_type:complete